MNAHVRDEASLVISHWQKDTLGQFWADMGAELRDAVHPVALNPDKPVYILDYVQGALITSGGPYCNATVAKSVCGNVGKWLEIDGGWRSEDGRSLIVSEVR